MGTFTFCLKSERVGKPGDAMPGAVGKI